MALVPLFHDDLTHHSTDVVRMMHAVYITNSNFLSLSVEFLPREFNSI